VSGFWQTQNLRHNLRTKLLHEHIRIHKFVFGRNNILGLTSFGSRETRIESVDSFFLTLGKATEHQAALKPSFLRRVRRTPMRCKLLTCQPSMDSRLVISQRARDILCTRLDDGIDLLTLIHLDIFRFLAVVEPDLETLQLVLDIVTHLAIDGLRHGDTDPPGLPRAALVLHRRHQHLLQLLLIFHQLEEHRPLVPRDSVGCCTRCAVCWRYLRVRGRSRSLSAVEFFRFIKGIKVFHLEILNIVHFYRLIVRSFVRLAINCHFTWGSRMHGKGSCWRLASSLMPHIPLNTLMDVSSQLPHVTFIVSAVTAGTIPIG
jgi:hypothetical protein